MAFKLVEWYQKRIKKAEKLLVEAKGAIDEELSASGEEWMVHPVLKGHARISDRR